MKQRRINATPTIAALALTTLLILTALPQAGTAAPTVASLSTNPKRINESAEAHSFIRSPFVDSTPGTTPRLERQPSESLTALNSTEATERGASLSVFSVPSVASVIQSPGTTTADAFVARLDTFSCDDVTEIPQAECEALVALYNSTNGANWSNWYNSGWLDTNTPCSWYGVTCSAGHVTQLDLRYNQLSGSIPSQLGNLAGLWTLDLSSNQLSGSIPSGLGNLTNLQDLYLHINQLSGSIPTELGNLVNLQSLYLWGNQLSGSIPTELGNLASLQGLHLSSNQLSGSIPEELGNLVNLQSLYLQINQLSGGIPAELGNLANLQGISLSRNQLSGNTPPELGNLTNLQDLYLHSNQLSGSIPPELGNLTNLQCLCLYNNQLSGALPGTLTNLTNLYRFWFHDTDLCEPADAAFQTWLASISDLRSTGIICPTPFLDLPFEYTNFGEATLANKGGRGPGRVNAWFDHTYPNYGRNYNLTLWNGRIYTGAEQTYDDCLSYGTCYDGHNGVDFSYADPQPNEPGDQPLPIRPAAGGAILETVTACTDSCRYGSCSACGAYGNYVIVNHRNHYFTRYAHLREVYVSEGQSVTTADTLGIMGATGHVSGRGDGTHLHLSVYYDDNDDGTWGENEVVDPFHWRGSPPEPWEANGGPTSYYLWIHQVSTQDPVSGDQGATMTDTTGHIQATIPPGAFSGQAILELSPVPVAEPSAQLRGIGRSFWLRLLEWLLEGGGLQSATTLQSTTQFTLTKPITLTVTYTDTDVLHLDVTQLALHRWDEEQETWQPLTTTVDLDNHVVTAQTEDLGDFDLQAPLLCATDDLEPDDGYAAARWMWPNDWPLARGLDIAQDGDWVRFDAVQGVTYTIRTQNLAGGADTVLNLYDVDALTLLASNDDADGGPASELVWTAPYTGTFFVETVSAPGGTTDCSATYELTIATIPGDVIADCRVDIADIMQVASQWRCKCGDACYKSLYDLDGDCIITVVDIMLVAVHWGESCE